MGTLDNQSRRQGSYGVMQEKLRSEVLEYLSSHTTMAIATCGGEAPWAAAVFYVNHGFVFYYLSDPHSLHSRNLASNPSVAATIQGDYRDWREIKGVQLQGRAEKVTDRRENEEAERLYLAKYPFVNQWLLSLARKSGAVPGLRSLAGNPGEVVRRLGSAVFYKVVANRVLFVDNSRGFGYREELAVVSH